MIFVSVGTHEAPFDRMLRTVGQLELEEELVIQHGPSRVRCHGAVEFEYLPFDDVVAYVRQARAVIMHAGVGSVMISLANGKRPIVMSRLERLEEHVDDHQLEFARRLEAYGLLTLVEDEAAMVDALSRGPEPAGTMDDTLSLGRELRGYLASSFPVTRAS